MTATAAESAAETGGATDPAPPRRRGRGLRVALWSTAVLAVLVLAALGAIGWFYADEILAVAAAVPADRDVAVLDVDPEGGTVTLARTQRSADAGVWGLEGEGWASRVEEVVADDVAAGEVTRVLVPEPDSPVVGDLADVSGYAYPVDTTGVFDFEIEKVAVPGPLGDLPSYYVPGGDDTWVVFVHGRGSHRRDALRLLPTVVGRGHPALAISYRNDEEAPAAPDGRYGLGWTEWEDVAAAVDWAVERGAVDVVLVGYSMGGAIVGSYEHQVPDAPLRGMILDAPVVDWDYPLRSAAVERGLPTALTGVAKIVVTLRTGLRWDQLSLLERAGDLTRPMLLFHGTADATVPIEGSDLLAAARPDLVTYVRVPGVAHVLSWNADPEAYEASVEAFLDDIGA
jgi:alpha-beta hydrolase superfamily lysophospholipase